jgi:hypothetical protein
LGWGYGYQFWGLGHGCYAMLGMGNQMAICDPTHDLVFVINSDNQGNDVGYAPIVYAFFDFIFDSFRDSALPENSAAYEELNRYTSSRKLFVLPGRKETPFSENIKDKIYYAEDNPMGIKWFKLSFESNEGVFTYENSQGIKELRFGFGHNLFQKFPQTGYSDMIGGYSEPGNTYECAVSADWPEERKLRVRVQIIDKYFANLAIVFGFRNERCVSDYMKKSAEYFLDEYDGILNAKCDMAPKK